MNEEISSNTSQTSDNNTSDSPVAVSIQDEQINSLLDALNSIRSSMSDSLGVIHSDLHNIDSDIQDLQIDSPVAETIVPDGYYELMADFQAQQTFFISLIFGLLISIIFFSNFK